MAKTTIPGSPRLLKRAHSQPAAHCCWSPMRVGRPGVERDRRKWRRRASNGGPAMSQESAGERRRVVSGAESGVCGARSDLAAALESGGESCWCSNVASGAILAELLEAVDDALGALNAGEIDTTRARLLALAETVRPLVTGANEHGV